MLVYLAVSGQSYTREALATLFWPDYDPSRAYAYLRRTLWALKDALGAGWIDADRESISIHSNAELWVDVADFALHLAACTRHGHPTDRVCPDCLQLLSQSAELYRGDFLAGFSLRDCPVFDDWQFFQAESLRSQLAGVLDRLSACYGEKAEWEPAILTARRWLSLDPFQEAPHRRLMLLYTQAGQRNAALRQYEECARILQQELGVEPEAETQALHHKLKSGELAKKPAAISHIASPEGLTIRLPAPPTPFVGREEELAEIIGLLKDPQCRLLSLVGPGGIGKTRLAIEAASQLAQYIPGKLAGGVYFVPLAPLSAVESLVPAIGDALGLTFRSEELLGVGLESKTAQLIDYLRDRQILLVLDNFEQLISGVELLDELLTGASHLSLLVTTRERLNLPGEWVLQVGSLQVPNGSSARPLESYSAIQLFVQDARRARLDFNLSEQEMPWVVCICKLVDGVPLGIELASAWVKMLSCQEIASEIQRSLDFLATQRGLPDRHHSLRGVFMHSWELLSEVEKSAFSRLSVFRGPFSREAGQAMLGGDLPLNGMTGGLAPAPQVSALGLLTALVDKSLLRRAADGLYGMHELLKHYAAEMLQKDPQEATLARDQHACYYQLALDSLAKDLTGASPQPALRWIDREFEDIRAAWRWFLNQGELSSVMKIGNLMSRYYTISNRYQEAIQDYAFVINHLQDAPTQSKNSDAPFEMHHLTRAYAMAWYWNFSEAMGEGRDAEAHRQGVRAFAPSEQVPVISPAEYAKACRQKSLELAEQLPANDRAAIYLINRFGAGILDEQQVTALYQFSQETFIENGSSRDQAYTCLVYGGILEFQDFKISMQLYEEGLEISRQVGDPWIISIALLSLAQTLYFSRGSYDRAQGYLLEALQIARQLGDSWLVIGVLIWLGQVGTALGQYEPAIAYYQECLALVREKGDRRMIAILLACLGHVHYLKKENTEAQQVFEESLEICQATDDQHEMGMAYGNLGNVARAQGDYAQAREHFLQSIELLERTGERWGLCLNTKRLGHCYSEMGEIDLAWETYQRAMQLALQHDLPPEMLEILLGVAGLLVRQGELGRATELASLVLAQSATSMDTRESAMQLLGEIECSLPEDEFAAAWQRGRALLLHAIAESYQP